MWPELHFKDKKEFCMPHRSSLANFLSAEILNSPLINQFKRVLLSSKEPPHLKDLFNNTQYMFWLRNYKVNFPLHSFIWRSGMKGCYTKIHYQMLLKQYNIGSHLCTNIVMLGISFLFLKLLCHYIPAFQTETDRNCMVIITFI